MPDILDQIEASHRALGGLSRGRRYANSADQRRVLVGAAERRKRRKLDSGNANPGNLGEDFGRFGLGLWSEIRSADGRARLWHDRLQELNLWRNAVAHQDFVAIG